MSGLIFPWPPELVARLIYSGIIVYTQPGQSLQIDIGKPFDILDRDNYQYQLRKRHRLYD